MTRVEERRLAELLESAAPAAEAVPFDAVARRVRRRRTVQWSTAGLAAAAAVAAVAVSLVVSADGSDSGRSSRLTTKPPAVDLAGTVPWIDAPPQPYHPLMPPPLPPADARPCAAADVTASFAGSDSGVGQFDRYVQFRNVSHSTCVLKGYPKITAIQPGLPTVTAKRHTIGSLGPTANMPPGHATLLGVETDNFCPAHPRGPNGPIYHHINVAMPGGGTVRLDRPSDGFDVGCGFYGWNFFVEQPVPHDPLNDLQVSLDAPQAVRQGTTLSYVAALTNPTDHAIGLGRCPGYAETVPTSPAVSERHALNCAAVSTIAAHHTVRFAMRLRIPLGASVGDVWLGWAFVNANGSANALVRIVPATPPSPSGSGS